MSTPDLILISLRERVREASASRTPLRLEGGGSKQWYGHPVEGATLDTRAYAGIVDYDPSELVVTVRCGTPLAELEALLASQGQMLGFEPPRFPGATVGGMFAAGLSGPRRHVAGAVRDFTLGAVLLDGHGQVLHFGGRVIKNVAGYDIARLLAGSLGTLGLVLEVSLKVIPMPVAETTLRFEFTQAKALERLAGWLRAPNAISATAWYDGTLALRLSGAEAAVVHGQALLGGERLADGEAHDWWTGLRDQRHPIFDACSGAGLWRLALPPTAAPLDLRGQQLLEWSGGQRWLAAEGETDAATVRALAERLGGHACRYRDGDPKAGVFHPLQPALARVHQRLKSNFDPARIFNPGRMYAEL